jgi:hypothetical protein
MRRGVELHEKYYKNAIEKCLNFMEAFYDGEG